MYFKLVRKRTPEIIKLFRERKAQIKQQHTLLLKKREAEKIRKQLQKQQEIEKLTKDIQNIGGLWVKIENIEKNLLKLSQNEKIEAVKIQLKFRKKVLHMNVVDKTLLQFSSNNVSFTLKELIGNLKILITNNPNLNFECETEESSDEFVFCIKSKDEREEIMIEQRELISK